MKIGPQGILSSTNFRWPRTIARELPRRACGILSACGLGGVLLLSACSSDEVPAAISVVRVLPGGDVQAMVLIGNCSEVSRVKSDESANDITLEAFEVSTTDEPCAERMVRAYVSLPLDGGELGNRTVLDASTGQTVRILRCTVSSIDPICVDSPPSSTS